MQGRARRQAFLTAICATTVLSLAQATAATAVSPPGFKVKSSNGYQVFVSAINKQHVLLTAVRRYPSGGLAYVSYAARGKVTATTIRARFGKLGLVSVRFIDAGRGGHSTQCHHEYTFGGRLGSYRGTIAFRGEGGYTKTRATGGKVAFPPRDPVACALQLGSNERTSRILEASHPQNAASFLAFKIRSPGESFLSAGVKDRQGRVRITRSVEAVAPATAFIYDGALTVADISGLPAPFTGSAHFQRDTRTWTGDLEAAFPGGPVTGLAGAGFSARLNAFF
jgi:hypothetical protein